MITVSKTAKAVATRLIDSGYQAYYVGGCVRDALIGRPFNDIDIATNATPDEMCIAFAGKEWRVVPTGEAHGTMTILQRGCFSESESIEVTTFRKDITTDGRKATVEWAKTIEEDLARRDFTMNAIAFDVESQKLVDPFDGIKDINKKTIRFVGAAADRIQEDYLRILRGIRFVSQLGFFIRSRDLKEMTKNIDGLSVVSWERRRDELMKMFKGSGDNLFRSLELVKTTGAVRYLLPKMVPSIGCLQNIYHADDVWTHSVLACVAMKNTTSDPELVLAALLHDVGKPQSKGITYTCRGCGKRAPENRTGCIKCGKVREVVEDCTFYAHDAIGASIGDRQLKQLRFSNKTRERVTNLIRYHLFRLDSETYESKCDKGHIWRSYYSKYAPDRPAYLPDKDKCSRCNEDRSVNATKISDESSLSAIRRLVRKVGGEQQFYDLLLLRAADRAGNRKKHGTTFHQRLAKYMYEAAIKDSNALKTNDLAIGGKDLKELGLEPGPVYGRILKNLLERVLDEPELNEQHKLLKLVEESNEYKDAKSIH